MCNRFLIALVVSLSLASPPIYAQSEGLPDIGSPSDSVLSKQQEAQIGRAIYKSIWASGNILTDPEVQEYVQGLGQNLGAHAQDGDQQFRFFVVNDPAINAFALPGGVIGVHSGLILATKTESELAGVLAHEIAHVTQRHISRAIYANQKQSIFTMAALLGAILVGVAGGVDGEIVQGAIQASQGMAIEQQIGFTRSSEYEADRVGVGVLATAGYDPIGMPDFFETMGRVTGSSGSRTPEFLRTHPISTDRVAESRARADQYPEVDRSDTIGYSLTKARVRFFSSGRPDIALNYFINEQKQPENVGDIGIEYGIALSLLEMQEYEGARERFAELLQANEEIIHFYTGLAEAQMGLGDRRAAFATYEQAMDLFPRNVPLTVRYSEALLQYGDPGLAHETLLDLLNQVPPMPEQVRLIAIAANEAGDTADAHYYMAEYHLLNGDLRMAIDQLRLALGIPGLESVQRARFLARLQQLQGYMPSQAQQRGQSGK